MLGLLQRNLHSCSKGVKETAYKTLVRSKLEYCGAIWDPYIKSDKTTLENVQRRAARFVLNNYNYRDSVTNMLTDLKWEPLEERRTRLRLIAIYKEVHNFTPPIIQLQSNHSRTTRHNQGTHVIVPPPFSKRSYQYSMYPRTAREWNFLPPNIRAAPDVCSFKSSLTNVNLRNLVSKTHFKI
ncbi:hypothetical protein HOLleu_40607 [Holothuria leucospilota]|uniref:Uncharacterized protein n=1 Tax=Holothuria leucospilota TaxID=206669 RepID=A0A9Q0YHX3_HOLLE|nr:hypothetical protein HOLleu_40607 [Holothuria leucospilota]